MNLEHHKSFPCYLLIFLHFFLGIGALFGGGSLILSPDGSLLHVPITLLQYTPFHNFFIPGLILFLGLGVLPLFTAIYLISDKPIKGAKRLCIDQSELWSWNLSLYIGFILIIWITMEIYMIQAIVFIHVFYIFLGLAIQAVTLLPSVRSHYSKTK